MHQAMMMISAPKTLKHLTINHLASSKNIQRKERININLQGVLANVSAADIKPLT